MSEEVENNLSPTELLIRILVDQISEEKGQDILEITDVIDELKVFPLSTKWFKWYNINLMEPIKVDFIYILNILEKLQNPQNLLDQLVKMSPIGYIQTASPIVECLYLNYPCKGEIMNRWIIWVDAEKNTLHLLPKYGFFEYIKLAKDFQTDMENLIKNYPHYSHSYYAWSPSKPLKYIIYEQGVNFDVKTQYPDLLKIAIENHVKTTNYFLNHINVKTNIFKDNDSISRSPEA
jgi:hypothetical protein